MHLQFSISNICNTFYMFDSLAPIERSVPVVHNLRPWFEGKFGLSTSELGLLLKYSKLRRQHSRQRIAKSFLHSTSMSSAYHDLSRFLPADALTLLIKAMDHFASSLSQITNNFQPMLIARQRNLLRLVSKKRALIHKVIDEARNFYRARSPPNQLTVYLVPNISKCISAGRAYVSATPFITLQPFHPDLECSANHMVDLTTLLHEVLHIIEARVSASDAQTYTATIKRNGFTPADAEDLREGIASTLFPSGYLAVKHGLVARPSVLRHRFITLAACRRRRDSFSGLRRKKLAALLYSETVKQLLSKRSIFDGPYLQKAARILVTIRGPFQPARSPCGRPN